MTTTQIGAFDYTIPAAYFGDFAGDFDTAAVDAAVCDALNAILPEGVTIARNGMIFADVDVLDVARGLDFAELLATVDVDAIVEAHQHRYTAHRDNAGGVHLSDGRTAWFLGFDYNIGHLTRDLDAFATGEWQPSVDDGQTPETLDDYAAMAARTDSTRLA